MWHASCKVYCVAQFDLDPPISTIATGATWWRFFCDANPIRDGRATWTCGSCPSLFFYQISGCAESQAEL